MVIRRRLRAIFFPLFLYCVSGAAAGYFVWHALNGERGLKANDEHQARIAQLHGQLDALKAESATWRRRIDLVNGAIVDRDLLDEQARVVLGRADKNDLVVMLPSK
ncbi:septum formation initiator family protein [Methylocella sp.]|uniref:septum formation initiator family protein n=1 Tax=Methylocella sp. TaxID=1978226 RepID=UPI003783495E